METKMSAFKPSGLTSDFKPGDAVSYVPMHAHGDLGHADVEHGVVTSINPYFVFVRYGSEYGAKATSPHDLRHQHAPPSGGGDMSTDKPHGTA